MLAEKCEPCPSRENPGEDCDQQESGNGKKRGSPCDCIRGKSRKSPGLRSFFFWWKRSGGRKLREGHGWERPRTPSM